MPRSATVYVAIGNEQVFVCPSCEMTIVSFDLLSLTEHGVSILGRFQNEVVSREQHRCRS